METPIIIMFRIEKISKSFGDTLVLDDISLDIKKGEIIAIMGASGSGKSTLLRIISGLIKTDTGSFSSDGNREFTKSFVSQKPSLLPWLSIRENISYGLKLQGVSEDKISDSVTQFLKMTQLFDYAASLPQDLSGGMQQRAALATALATQPDILIMDEPLSALDTQTKSQIRDFVRALLVTQNQTAILVTHDPEEALFLADRIIIISPSPARIIDEIIVPFGEKRHRGIVYKEEFQDLKKYISYIMYAESIRTMTDVGIDDKKHLSIGSNIWAGTLPLYFAKEEKIFENYGLDSYHLLTLEWASQNRAMPINEGLVDVLNMTLETAMVACEENSDLRILMPVDVSNGGDALIASGDIKSLSDLIGKRIAVEKNWVSEFYLNYLLKKNNISFDAIQRVYLDSKDIPKHLLVGEVDAIVTQEPWLSEVAFLNKFNILETTRNDEVIYAALVVSQKTMNEKMDLINSFVSGLQESINMLLADKTKAVRKTSHLFGISENHLLEQLENVRFIPADEYEKVKEKIDSIESVLIDSGMIKRSFDKSKLLF
jgi:NitT/TauT family transport system ATP-binding protein